MKLWKHFESLPEENSLKMFLMSKVMNHEEKEFFNDFLVRFYYLPGDDWMPSSKF